MLSKLLLMCSNFHVRGLHLFSMLKKKSKYLCVFSQNIFSPGLPNLGAQIRCAQNRYTAAQIDLKYAFYCVF